MDYTIEDLDNKIDKRTGKTQGEAFVEETILTLEEKYKEYINIFKCFNTDINDQVTPTEKYDPVKKDMIKFRYPLAYDVWILYYFIKSEIGLEEDVERSLARVIETIQHDPIMDEYDYDISYEKWINSRIGFMVYVAELKLRLLEGDDFSAVEVGTMIGLTGQAIINRINRGIAEGKKRGRKWVITNDQAREIIKDADSFILPDDSMMMRI